MPKTGTIREARSKVITAAREVVATPTAGFIATLEASLKVLDERTAASNEARKKGE